MIPANDNGRPINFISMFSGIEAASVAFRPLGWKAICFAEIEKFPAAVLAHHYPDVTNVGDMSKHDWSQYAGKVDVVCGGPPCQDFSVAGLRAGLDGDRGNLSLVYMRALHAIKPRNAIVENVPGWLSDKKNAFGCFLAGLVGADDPLRTPDGKSWPNAGMVAGPLGRAAWRILDAQYFGLAQRRRRVLVVADFGNGADPAAVLFEPEGVLRHPPTRGEAGKSITHPIAPSIVSSGRGVERTGDTRGQDPVVAVLRGHSDYGPGAPTLRAKGGDCAGGSEALVCGSVAFGGNRTSGPLDVATAVNAHGGPHGRLDFESETFLVSVVAFAENSRAEARLEGGDGQTVGTLAQGGGKPGQGYAAVCVTGDITHTLKAEGADASEDGTGRGTPVIAFDCKASGMSGFGVGEIASTMRAMGHADSYSNGGGHQAAAIGPAVRRLTPVECERLQGFPDFYTRIPLRAYAKRSITKNRPEDMWEHIDGKWWLMSADGPRYKALGNSWAVPKFEWLGRRIQMLMPANDNAKPKEPERTAA